MPKYRYADNSNNKIVDVTKLQKQNLDKNEVFKCIGCSNILIPVLGQKRQKHFRHKIDIDCSPETYLHKLAKTRFYEVYNDCIRQNASFLITINQQRYCNYYESEFLFRCDFKEIVQTFDLTKYFREIRLEKKEDSFIPDLLMISKTGDKLFIEIAVTHQVSQKKIDSGSRIIEIYIANEDDIEIINSKNLAQGETVKFFNFKNQMVKNFCRGKCHNKLKPYSYCKIKYDYFVIFNNGKSAILRIDLDEINKLYKEEKIKYKQLINSFVSNLTKSDEYIRLVIESFVNDRGIQSCFLCRYHGTAYYSDEPIFCKFLKKNCNSNEAANCKYYRPDTKVFPSLNLHVKPTECSSKFIDLD